MTAKSVNSGKAQVAMHKNTRTHLKDTSCRLIKKKTEVMKRAKHSFLSFF